ncbi:hypothetical protein [Bradyrhizobium sp. BTAi1]|uniref:hypothetical protein n=1 Tax=Bradyrhizobium sp. (strain BTAi1 / ATCC BAA-1182) TaxID=288000 RepID=UPI0011D089B4|nr:hypothetical protein [Bradyrhizobium sp. BTAi1]
MNATHSPFIPFRNLLVTGTFVAALAVTAASAQTQQAAPPADQQQPAAPSTGSSSMPMQGMEHGRQMQNMGPKMMEREMGKDGQPCSPGGQTTSSGQTGAGGSSNCK